MSKIEINNVYKIFGPNPKSVLPMVKDGSSKEEILENFKTAIGSTVKSLSNSENVEVSFGNQNLKTEKISIRLTEIERLNDKFNYDQIRALADSESLKIRFSNKK